MARKLNHDPQESDRQKGRLIRQAHRQAAEELADLPQFDGFCHMLWYRQKQILKEKGIEWRSPADMNPNVLFD